ncbi:MAG: T9SS type A sorting domain-containing protein, partial [Prevotella sp.]|nr:T9SS type A sorting domain-containing protein [Prevotella sp.]
MVTTSVFSQNTDDDDILYVYTKNNNEAELYQLDGLNKITFSNSGVRIWNTNWPTEYPYSKVSFITFRDRNYIKPTSIETTYADEEQIRINYSPSSGVVTVKSSTLLDGIAVYDLQGQLIDADHTSRQFYQLSLKHVYQGVYVVKAKGKRSETVKK